MTCIKIISLTGLVSLSILIGLSFLIFSIVMAIDIIKGWKK